MVIELKLSNRKIQVTNQNPRPEKHGQEELDAAFDLSARTEVTTDELSQICYGVHKASDFNQLFYGVDGGLKSEIFTGIGLSAKFEDHRIILQYDPAGEPVEFKNVKLCKFKTAPQQNGFFGLAFQIQINPTNEQLHYLVDGLTFTEWQFESLGAVQGDMLEGVEPNEDQEEDEAA